MVELTHKQVLYEAGDPIRHAHFPHHAVVSLVNVLEDGNTVEVALFGRGGVVGLLSALVSREAFGRYVVQMAGTASRIAVEAQNEVRNAHPKLLGWTAPLRHRCARMRSLQISHTGDRPWTRLFASEWTRQSTSSSCTA
ncbi:cyclic nucleotide-binding domain-containing protein [Microvirga aerophila]|uniref:cyclic nucleotide-binding domain-containing protein n=1 Tax=Microvirga aerophila TaxID=670291 RepID=UPI003B8A7FE4